MPTNTSVLQVIFAIIVLNLSAFGQSPDEGGMFSGWTLPVVLVMVGGLGALIYLRSRTGKGGDKTLSLSEEPSEKKAPRQRPERTAEAESPARPEPRAVPPSGMRAQPVEVKAFKSQSYIGDLPISKINSISQPTTFEQLPESDDDGLMAAIDELQDDSESDSDFRMIALRVLGGFRTRNSVEALTQIALYDLSTTLRTKAVAMLADFDHESVFEAIVLSCADPSREVRTAGARALVKVTFDRANEWARYAATDSMMVSRQVARAAVESGIAERSFDRLVLRDEKAAYEAAALVYLLIKTGETEKVFQAIREHRDVKTRLALLHVVKIANVAEVIPELSSFIAGETVTEVADKAREALLGITALPVGA